ncbi:hypothetical protein SLA2020_016980 [Shorea laevis]
MRLVFITSFYMFNRRECIRELRWKVVKVLWLSLSRSNRSSSNHGGRATRKLSVRFPTDGAKCNCTKPEVLLQATSVLRIDLQSPEVELGVDTPMLKSVIIRATFRMREKGA